MLQLTPQMRILVAVEAVDFRKGIDSLAELCRAKLNADPFSGCLFVFRSRRATSIKVLVYDGQGFWLATKRLSKGRFRWWQQIAEGAKELPCIGTILSMVLMLEIGRVDRFPTAAHLASYAGLVPRVHSSGGHTRMGQVCGNVNRNLKWAFVEAGNLIVISQRRLAGSHVVRLYQSVKRRKNHQKAVVAVARHLAEAAWWVLTRQEVYREPQRSQRALSSTHG